MKILAVIGSPRKGTSYHSVQIMEEYLKSLGDVEFEYLFLKDYRMQDCRGCESCVRFGIAKCPLGDDVAEIEKKMLAADAVMLVSPIYSFHITAKMKQFIDRYTYWVHRPPFAGKFAYVYVLRGAMFGDSIRYLKQVAKSWGFAVAGSFGGPALEQLADKPRAKDEAKIKKQMRIFYDTVKNGKLPKPKLGDLIYFGIWKGNAVTYKEFIPADYEYWQSKGWLQSDYYYPARVNPISKLITHAINAMIGSFMKKIFK